MGTTKQTHCFEIGSDHRLYAIGWDDAVSRWRDGGGLVWIDVENCDDGDRKKLLDDIGVDPSSTARLLEDGHSHRVLTLDDGLYFEFPLRIAGDPPELKWTSVLCFDRLVVTLREIPASRPQGVVYLDGIKLPPAARSSADLACVLLTESSLDLQRVTSEIRNSLVTISKRLDEDPDVVDLQEIVELKRAVIDADAVAEERTAILEIVPSIPMPGFDLTQGAGFRLAVDSTSAAERRINRIARRVADVQSRYESHQQDKMNRRLSRLTIISAIFLPLTLLAGVYGMNFENMPGLHFEYGYPIALGGMAVIAIALLWWFKKHGWMD